MRRWLWLALWLMTTPALALEIPLTSGGALSLGIPIRITTVEGDPVTAQTLTTVDLYYACSGQVETAFVETGDTLPEIDPAAYPGDYYLVSNDVLASCAAPNVMQVRGTGTDLVISAPLVEVVFQTITGTVVSSADCTNAAGLFDTDLGSTYTRTDAARYSAIVFLDGILTNELRQITGYNTNGCMTTVPFSGVPSAGNRFRIVNQ